jgi:hypothetical protein
VALKKHSPAGELMTETLFVTDAEMIQRLGVPEKIASVAIRAVDCDPRLGFPRKQNLGGNRRYWPAIRHYFDIISGIAEDTHGFMRGGRDIVL